MDMRVLAAVFLTLLAVAVGMSQGDLDLQDVQDSLDTFRTSGDLSKLLQRAGNQSYNTSTTGSLTSSSPTTFNINTPAALTIDVTPSTAVTVGDSTLKTSADTAVSLNGFRGTIEVAPDNTSITGAVEGLSTSAFDFTYNSPKDITVTSSRPSFALSGLEQQSFRLANATGSVRIGGTTIAVENEKAWFNAYSGNVSVDGTTYDVDGTVRSALLGDAEVG